MASGLGNAIRAAMLDQVFGGGDYTRLGTLYVALLTTAHSSSAGGGTEVSTGTWTDYARVAIDNDGAGTVWASAVSGNKSSGADIEWPAATISGTAPTILGWCIYDASSGGNIMAYGLLNVSRTVTNGSIFKFPTGSLDIDMNNTA